MSVANAVLTVGQSFVDRIYNVTGVVAIDPSPATYTTGGIPFNLNQSTVKASRTPEQIQVFGTSGYQYRYVKGSDNSNGLLKVFQQDGSTGPLVEITNAAAIPAGVSGDTISFRGQWKGMF